jgi:hypothetical protein
MPGLGGEFRGCVVGVKRSRFVRQAAVFIGSGASISAQIQRKLLCSAVVYREHLSGRRHKSRLARKIAGAQHCDICDITIENKAQFDTHLGGRRHRKAILDQVRSADWAATLALVDIEATVPTSARTFPLHLRSAPLPR